MSSNKNRLGLIATWYMSKVRPPQEEEKRQQMSNQEILTSEESSSFQRDAASGEVSGGTVEL